MTNPELKEMIADYIPDEEILNRIVVLEGDEFADGAIRVSEDNRLVYSYDRLVQALAKAYRDGKPPDEAEMDAIEWLEYNTIRSLPYMEGGKGDLIAPMIIHEF